MALDGHTQVAADTRQQCLDVIPVDEGLVVHVQIDDAVGTITVRQRYRYQSQVREVVDVFEPAVFAGVDGMGARCVFLFKLHRILIGTNARDHAHAAVAFHQSHTARVGADDFFQHPYRSRQQIVEIPRHVDARRHVVEQLQGARLPGEVRRRPLRPSLGIASNGDGLIAQALEILREPSRGFAERLLVFANTDIPANRPGFGTRGRLRDR